MQHLRLRQMQCPFLKMQTWRASLGMAAQKPVMGNQPHRRQRLLLMSQHKEWEARQLQRSCHRRMQARLL